MSTGSEVEVDGDVEEGEEHEVDEPSSDEIKAWDPTTMGRCPLGRRFESPESLAKKADAKLAKKKEPVAPKFDVATAAPSQTTRAAARAQHDTQEALAQSIGADIMAAPLQRLGRGDVARCERRREEGGDAKVVAKTIHAAHAARKAHAAIAAINARAHRDASGDGSCDDMRGGPAAGQLRDPPQTVAAAVLPTPVRALLQLAKSPSNPAPSPTTEPWWEHKTVEQLVGWYGLDHGGSDRARFRLHVDAIVDQYDCDNDEQRIEKLLLARKSASAPVWERSRFALLGQLQELETSDEPRSIVEALFFSLELVTVATGRNCNCAVMKREHQLKHYPVVPPTITSTFVFDPVRDQDKWYIFYLPPKRCFQSSGDN